MKVTLQVHVLGPSFVIKVVTILSSSQDIVLMHLTPTHLPHLFSPNTTTHVPYVTYLECVNIPCFFNPEMCGMAYYKYISQEQHPSPNCRLYSNTPEM